MQTPTVDDVRELLHHVYDPELGVNVVDLGLIYEIRVEQSDVYVKMTLTTPGCPLHNTMTSGVRTVLEAEPNISTAHVELVWNPPWTPDRMSEEAREMLGH